ncbi:MAG: PAS domain S-box protein [Proteobacteria bacterium]|nr:PAS domain S-box protein [Pseudomonadota bacterium]MBU4297052.1 PAS domain S-box protein [Pseudomonadota bacterium]MCG2749933.1 PAS domain S-box protein [Desulfobulbaceae bacterium]
MPIKKRFLVIPLLVFLSAYLPYLLYREVKQITIDEFDARQMVYARQAARSIENLLNRFFNELSYIASIDDIVRMGPKGEELLRKYYEKNQLEILAITRVDSTGRIIYTEPYNSKAIGADISSQPHVAQILLTHKPVISDVFTAVQGHRCIAYHVPVIADDAYAGSMAILIPFSRMAEESLETIRTGESGHIFMIGRDGVVLYSDEPSQTGKKSDEIYHHSPAALAMIRQMTQSAEGRAVLTFASGKGEVGHAVYSPVEFGAGFWSIAVVTPEREVLATMRGFKNKWFLLLAALVCATFVSSYYIFRSWVAAKEETKRKKTEEALRDSERNYRALVESANSIVLKWDTTGIITYLNPFGLKFFGFTLEEILGRNVMGTIVPETESTGRDLKYMIDDILVNPLKYKNNFNQNMKKSGERVWISWTNEPIVDSGGNFIEIQSIGNDLTALKNAEEAIKESERKYKMVADATSDIIYEYQVDEARLTYVSPNCGDILGYNADELLGQSEFPEAVICQEDAEAIRERRRQALRGSETKMALEYGVICKNGDRKFVVDHSTLQRDENGRVVSMTGSIKDISNQKELEEKLRRAEKMEAIGTLAGGVAHDLNNILSGLVSYPDLLLLSLPDDSPIRKTVLIIKKSGEKAAAIVNDLLTLARRGVSVTEVINLNATIREFVQSPEFQNMKARHEHVRLELQLDEELLNISGSPVHLTKTIMNLVVNAYESMPGSGEIRITTENRYVDKPVQGYDDVQEGDYVMLTVSDTGHGITPEDRQRIFEPFYTKKVMGRSGTGLGLAVVWGTVKDHHGYIDVRSSHGKGADFILYFPVSRALLKSKVEKLFAVEEYRGTGESILIVDDVSEQRELATQMLAQMGYLVESAASGDEAVALLVDREFDLLVLDMIMEPGMDGLDTYKALLGIRAQQKAIIASGYSETDRVHEAQQLGAGQYLRKPYTLEKLVRAVRDELLRSA